MRRFFGFLVCLQPALCICTAELLCWLRGTIAMYRPGESRFPLFRALQKKRGQAPGRIQSLRAFRRSAPRLSVVGRCLDFKAVGMFGELLYCQGHQLTSEAHSRWSHRGIAKSHRSGVICCRCACFWVRPLVPKSMFIRAGGHADKQPLDRVPGSWRIPP